jgi:hypothetical protein
LQIQVYLHASKRAAGLTHGQRLRFVS